MIFKIENDSESYFSQKISIHEYTLTDIYPCISIYTKSCIVEIYSDHDDIKLNDKNETQLPSTFQNMLDKIITTNNYNYNNNNIQKNIVIMGRNTWESLPSK